MSNEQKQAEPRTVRAKHPGFLRGNRIKVNTTFTLQPGEKFSSRWMVDASGAVDQLADAVSVASAPKPGQNPSTRKQAAAAAATPSRNATVI